MEGNPPDEEGGDHGGDAGRPAPPLPGGGRLEGASEERYSNDRKDNAKRHLEHAKGYLAPAGRIGTAILERIGEKHRKPIRRALKRIVLLAGFVIAYLTLRAATTANKQTELALQVTQRARVYVRGVRLITDPRPKLVFDIENVGPTDALQLRPHVSLTVERADGAFEHLTLRAAPEIMPPVGYQIGGLQRKELPIHAHEWSPRAGDRLSIWMPFSYWDEFGIQQEGSFSVSTREPYDCQVVLGPEDFTSDNVTSVSGAQPRKYRQSINDRMEEWGEH